MFVGVTDNVDSDRLYEYAGEVLLTDRLDGFIEGNPSREVIGRSESSLE